MIINKYKYRNTEINAKKGTHTKSKIHPQNIHTETNT